MSRDPYFDKPGMSASMLKAGAISMEMMRYRMNTPMKPTPAMLTGTFRHMAVLEHDKFMQLKLCDESSRTKAYKAAVEEHGREGVISSYDQKNHLEAAAVVMAHPQVRALGLFDDGHAEVEKHWTCEHGPCKAKIDWEAQDFWVEFKTTASIGSFIYQSERMNYPVQISHYASSMDFKQCYVVVQEPKPPYEVAVYSVPSYLPAVWNKRTLDIYKRWNEYKAGGVFGGAYPELMQYERPAWAEGQDSLAEVDIEELAF